MKSLVQSGINDYGYNYYVSYGYGYDTCKEISISRGVRCLMAGDLRKQYDAAGNQTGI